MSQSEANNPAKKGVATLFLRRKDERYSSSRKRSGLDLKSGSGSSLFLLILCLSAPTPVAFGSEGGVAYVSFFWRPEEAYGKVRETPFYPGQAYGYEVARA